MIIAILEAGRLEGKIRLPSMQKEIDILLPVMGAFDYSAEPKLTTTPRARFIWYRQISKKKHLYKLKEIL